MFYFNESLRQIRGLITRVPINYIVQALGFHRIMLGAEF